MKIGNHSPLTHYLTDVTLSLLKGLIWLCQNFVCVALLRENVHSRLGGRGERRDSFTSLHYVQNDRLSQTATTGRSAIKGSFTSTPSNGVPSSNHVLGAGAPHKVWRCGSLRVQRIGSKSGSTVR